MLAIVCYNNSNKDIGNPVFTIFLTTRKHKKKHHPQGSYVLKNGTYNAPSGARTLDTLIKSQVLYQLS